MNKMIKWKHLNEEDTAVVVSVFRDIQRELLRCYWNKNQKEMDSPFKNTGNYYSCKTFLVQAYTWDEDNNNNFVYVDKENPERSLIAYWYKYLGRGDYIQVPESWEMSNLSEMMNKCIKAIREDFGENVDEVDK